MTNDICVVTGNAGKWRILHDTTGDLLRLVQVPLETPEIQTLDVAEVARFSALWAARELGKPVLKTDVGYYLPALNGFPGPFVKWINQTLTPENILAMLGAEGERRILIREVLAYAEPDGFIMTSEGERHGRVLEVVDPTETAWKSVFDRIVVEDGMECCFARLTFEEQIVHISGAYRERYRAFAESIAQRQRPA